MSLVEPCRDPYDHSSFQASKISKYLSQMLQVCFLQLILDEYAGIILRYSCYDVRPVRTDLKLSSLKFQIGSYLACQ